MKKKKGFFELLIEDLVYKSAIEAARDPNTGNVDPYAVAGIAFGCGKMKNFNDQMRLAAHLGAEGAFDDHTDSHEWRTSCGDGLSSGISPENYEAGEEYGTSLEETGHAWRDDAVDGSEYGLDPKTTSPKMNTLMLWKKPGMPGPMIPRTVPNTGWIRKTTSPKMNTLMLWKMPGIPGPMIPRTVPNTGWIRKTTSPKMNTLMLWKMPGIPGVMIPRTVPNTDCTRVAYDDAPGEVIDPVTGEVYDPENPFT